MKVGIALLVLVIALGAKSMLHLLGNVLKHVGSSTGACRYVLTFVPFRNYVVDGSPGVLSGDHSR